MSMTMRDHGKVTSAGFRVFRIDEVRLQIREAETAGAWKVHSSYKTKAAMRRYWDLLMQDPKNLEG